MNDRAPDPAKLRRKEFAAFLRSRRESLTPACVGLPAGFRRRTPGLRREEVAMLTGVGATWYTWLEQGRDVRPSTEVLSALAHALRLDSIERQHLFALNDRPAPEIKPNGQERVPAPLFRILDSMDSQPAYVLGRRWDILAWNEAAVAVFGDYAKLHGDARNVLHLIFANPAHRHLLVDWDQLAPLSLAMFRADSARHLGDADFERLIATLKAASPEFRAWWPKHEVVQPFSGHKRIHHPQAGEMLFEYTSLTATDQSNLKLIVYTPLAECDTAAKLATLLANLHDPDQ